jgi:hypothetical protein
MKIQNLIIATTLLSLGACVNAKAMKQQVQKTKATKAASNNMEEQAGPIHPKTIMMEGQVRKTQAPSTNNSAALKSLKDRLKGNSMMEEHIHAPNNINNNKNYEKSNKASSQKSIFNKNIWSQVGNMEALVGNRIEKKEQQKSIQEILMEIQETLHGDE